jgi:A/G-specific adenine glycosylase
MPKSRPRRATDASLARRVSEWFTRTARPLPWRTTPRDPYHSLVAETMLQQTQVSRVIDKYTALIDRFPTVHALAAADEHDVLAMWTGLGYYRRARNLHAAARTIVSAFNGRIPDDVESLRTLPGVGRYTAGAIASIAHGMPAPIVDGNVARVLLRIHGRDAAPSDKPTQAWLWERAEALVNAAADPARFNEGLMELGALICTPAPSAPDCGACPLRRDCVARATSRQLEIPRTTRRSGRTTVYCAVAVIQRPDGALLIEQRPGTGMWARMWQAPTLERTDRAPTRAELARAVDAPAAGLTLRARFEFLATHRRMLFDVYHATSRTHAAPARGEFRPRSALARLPMSSPQRRALDPRTPGPATCSPRSPG